MRTDKKGKKKEKSASALSHFFIFLHSRPIHVFTPSFLIRVHPSLSVSSVVPSLKESQ
jgi:hypothetical protein